MSSGAIQAGSAYVALGTENSELDAGLAAAKARLAAFSASVAGVSARVATAASAGIAATVSSAIGTGSALKAVSANVASVNVATAATGRTHSVVGAIATATWRGVTGSVVGMTGALVASSVAIKALGLQSTVAGRLMQGALGNRRLIGAGGIVASLAGALTGSSTLRNAGAMAGRASIGLSIVDGFNRSGWRGALGASLSSGLKYATVQGVAGSVGLARRTLGGLFSLPSSAARGAVSGFASIQRAVSGIIPGMRSARAAADATTDAMQRGGGVGQAVSAQFRGFVGGVSGLMKVGVGAAVALTAVGMKAATQFASTAADIKAKAKESGQSVASIIDKQFGTSLAGTLISEGDIEAGAKLKEAMSGLGATIQVAWAQVGAAIAPVLSSFYSGMTAVVSGIAVWLSQNRELIATSFKVVSTVALVTAGVGATVGVMALLGPAVVAVLNPFSLLTGAIVGGVAAWSQYSEEGQASLSAVTEAAGVISDTVSLAVGGVVDALAAGDMSLAAEIGLDGVKAVFVEVSAALSEIWTNVTASMANWLVDSGFMESINTAISHIENGFTRVMEFVSGWVIEFKSMLGVISEEQAKAMQAENKASANAAVETRTRQMEVENKQFRENPAEVKRDIETEKQARLEAVRAERDAQRAAAQEKLRDSVTQAGEARHRKDAELAAAAESRKGKESTVTAIRVASSVQFGASGANRQGAGAVWTKMTDLAKKTAENTGRMVNALEGNLQVGA